MVAARCVFGYVLRTFSEVRLIQVIQATALLTMVLNWHRVVEAGAARPVAPRRWIAPRVSFREACGRDFARVAARRAGWSALGLGTVAFSMQDVLLEPYGGQVLHLTVGADDRADGGAGDRRAAGFGSPPACWAAAPTPTALAAIGALAGLVAFSCVIFSAPLELDPRCSPPASR